MSKKHRKQHLRKRKSDQFVVDDDFEMAGSTWDEKDEHVKRRLRRQRRLGNARRDRSRE